MSRILGDYNCSFQVLQRAVRSKRPEYTLLNTLTNIYKKWHRSNNGFKLVKIIKNPVSKNFTGYLFT